MKALVVDDERLARVTVVDALRKLAPEVDICEAANGLVALDLIRDWAPDVVFLDVEMPVLDGFGVLGHFEECPFAVIFVTAFEHYAVKAFEREAVDYVMKPFSQERLEAAWRRACRRQGGASVLAAVKNIRAEQQRYQERFILKRGVHSDIVEVGDIEFARVEERYAALFAGGHEYLVPLSLLQLEQNLPPDRFCRIHRNYLVNVNRVRSLSDGAEGTCVVMESGERLPVARRERKNLLSRLPAGLLSGRCPTDE